MCSGSEAGSYLIRIDCVYHSTLGLGVIKKALVLQVTLGVTFANLITMWLRCGHEVVTRWSRGGHVAIIIEGSGTRLLIHVDKQVTLGVTFDHFRDNLCISTHSYTVRTRPDILP